MAPNPRKKIRRQEIAVKRHNFECKGYGEIDVIGGAVTVAVARALAAGGKITGATDKPSDSKDANKK